MEVPERTFANGGKETEQKQERRHNRLQEIWERQKNKADRDALLTQTKILSNFAKIYEVTGNEIIVEFLNKSIDNLIPADVFEESPLDSVLEELQENLTPEELEKLRENPVLSEDKATEIMKMPDGTEVEFDVINDTFDFKNLILV